MPLIKRIGYYLLGFSIGVVFLAFFFKEKRTEFCYLPNCRVMKELRSKPLENDVATTGLSDAQINLIFADADVLFSQSDVRAEPCKIYVIKGKIENEKWTLTVSDCSEKVIVTSAEKNSK